jgi:DNA-binding beta-propeller fold protein YncE
MRLRGALAFAALLLGLAWGAVPAYATDPLLVFSPEPVAPQPPEPPPPPIPPPNGYLNGPCGLAVDSGGRLYIADHYHDVVDVFSAGFDYLTQAPAGDPDAGPCGLALDAGGSLYAGGYHGAVERLVPSAFPPEGDTSYASEGQIGASPSTGVAVAQASGDVYVNRRDRVSLYDSAGTHQIDIGLGDLEDGYGLAVSSHSPTAGFVYVADAADDTVKVYDPATDATSPVQTILGPPGGFTSLRDSAVAVDRVSGEVYVVDVIDPADTEQPRARVQVFSSAGAYKGHLKYDVVHGAPSGLAVDNSTANSRGRVYVTSGNTHHGGVYAYPPNAATGSPPLPPTIPPLPLGGDSFFPTTSIGGPGSGAGGILCEGDACQTLPPEPVDPTLTTLLRGLGNPKVRYRRARRNCRHARHRARACGRANRGRGKARASASSSAAATPAAAGSAVSAHESSSVASQAAALLPAPAGFAAAALADGGEAATLAGSHPYSLDLTVGLDQGGGEADLRELRLELPPGLLANPAATSLLCSAADFASLRSSPYDASASGESCPDRAQVGTLDVTTGAGGGQTRRFGLFELEFAEGAAMRLGAAPFGVPVLFDAEIDSGPGGPHLAFATEVPEALEAEGLALSLWGIPWDASHNGERGNCLNEAEPSFPWAKCSVGEPLQSKPLAFLTLPTACGEPLEFTAWATSWQGGGLEASAVNRDGEDQPVPLAGCDTLPSLQSFDLNAEGLLSVSKASSSSGFVFRFGNEDPGLADPRARIRSHVREAVVELPDGVTLNPSLGAGLEVCEPADLGGETPFNPPGAGCPNGSKIGSFSLRSPFYDGRLRGGLYLAEPFENPFDSLVAVYLIAKSADRGILITAAGELRPDPADGTLTAVFTGLPQLPYTDLEVNVRSGQRAPLVSPPRCGKATTEIELVPWSGGESKSAATATEIESGIDGGPCPQGTPPFAPDAIAGGVNSNVGSYTPYFVHLIRKDTEQEIISYSLTLPEGIVGKLAGIPFCPDAAIARARGRGGADEAARPSCPEASQVGRTLTGYGVGSALTYATGHIYLAGPYRGQPLSLVTINSATVGPFDLGTIVVRSAFSVDPRTAQLAIDSSASDPIPHILEGVPLHLRDIRVYIDRTQFTRNPTGCEAAELVSTLTGSGASFERRSDDSSAVIRKHFQLLNCLTLDFRPSLGLRLRGGARRGAYPGLRAVYRAREPDADLKRIAVTMPRSLFLAQNHIRTVCTRVQFAADACPPGSVYGRAAAHTPLFDEPLRGPVVLRSSDHNLPDLVASLRSGEVRIVLEGEIGPSKSGGIRAFFDGVPDAPVDRFTMWLRGGAHGLLVNSVDTCANPPQAVVKALAHNNRGAVFTTKLRGRCAEERRKRGRGASTSEVAQEGDVRVVTTGRLTPKRLPRKGVAPIAVSVGGKIRSTDGDPPPQLRTLRIELNRHGRLETRGLPTCRPAQIYPASTARALAACRSALVGRGSFSVDVVLAGQEPYPTTGRLLVFNGRYKGRRALLGQIYSPKPFSTSFFVPFAIRELKGSRYGIALTASLPRALGTWGHVTGMQMRLARRYSHRGKRHSFISAGCPAPEGFPGALFSLARTTFGFEGGERLTSTLTRECRVKG